MADHITHVHSTGTPADDSGMGAFMIVVLLVAVLALGAFVFYVTTGGDAVTPAERNSVNLDVNLPTPAPAPANTPPAGTAPQN